MSFSSRYFMHAKCIFLEINYPYSHCLTVQTILSHLIEFYNICVLCFIASRTIIFDSINIFEI